MTAKSLVIQPVTPTTMQSIVRGDPTREFVRGSSLYHHLKSQTCPVHSLSSRLGEFGRHRTAKWTGRNWTESMTSVLSDRNEHIRMELLVLGTWRAVTLG